jgi:hypothetical protein
MSEAERGVHRKPKEYAFGGRACAESKDPNCWINKIYTQKLVTTTTKQYTWRAQNWVCRGWLGLSRSITKHL